jgi:hypothetical protein
MRNSRTPLSISHSSPSSLNTRTLSGAADVETEKLWRDNDVHRPHHVSLLYSG